MIGYMFAFSPVPDPGGQPDVPDQLQHGHIQLMVKLEFVPGNPGADMYCTHRYFLPLLTSEKEE